MKPVLNIERLREKRLEKGWTKLAAAREMGFAQSGYVRYENGLRKPTAVVVRNMALALGTSVEYLTGQSDDPKPLEFVVSAEDEKLFHIVETYKAQPEKEKERIYNYIKKIGDGSVQ